MKLFIKFLILFLCAYQQINAQTTAIPDANFESKLVSLGIDSDGLVNGQILNSDAAVPTVLNVSSSSISDLTGIAAFTNLQNLDCQQNNLTLLDISLTNIDTLNCSYNAITSLTLPTAGSIKHLACHQNQLTNILVANQTNLEHLDVSINSISTLNLTNNTALEVLKADANSLTTIDLTNNTALERLQLTHNQLSTINLSNNTSLTFLNLTNNFLPTIDLSSNILLRSLDINNNLLTGINLLNNTALERLSLSFNQITTLDVSSLTALEIIYSTDNQLSQLDFSNNTVLEKIYTSNNQITNINVTNSSILRHIDVSDNQLTTLNVNNNTALFHLNIDDNQISVLDLSNNLTLGELKASNNQLVTLDLTNNTSLSSALAVRCQLTSVNLPTSNTVQTLSFTHNRLNSIDVSVCPNLRYLQLGNNHLHSLYLGDNPDLVTAYLSGNQLSQLNLSHNPDLFVVQTMNNSPSLVICVSDLSIISSSWLKDATAIYTTSCGANAVQVNVKVDANSNCIADSIESVLSNQIIQFERQSDGNIIQLYSYDTSARHPFYLDTGTYVVTLATNHPYWQPCIASHVLTVDTNLAIQYIDFAMQPIVSCPYLEVDLSAPFLRMAGGGSAYTIHYCNTGTVVANNAYVEVDLDADLNYTGATIPLISQIGNTYRFDVGNINAGDCGSFDIQVVVDNTAGMGQTHCTNVSIYPDSICSPIIIVPSLTGNASCQNDTIVFYLENVGSDMLQTHQFDIFEDNIAMRTGTVQLNSGQFTTIIQPALEGKTYRIVVDQAPNYPKILGDPTFTAAIEGCNPRPNGSFNTGFVTQFSNGLSQPTQAVDCQQNIAAYDPNDKAAQPMGYDTAHYIYANTAIDYKVRFQNTGNDTAFNIVILDTLSSYVNPATLQMGASSHSYNWSILNGNILRVDFPNIMLVDSNANEPLSHGFFRYRIEQQPNNALGSVIYNQAAIYFDYNPPIFTNTTFHTIGEDFVTKMLLSVEEVLEDQLEVLVYPNPFEVSTTIAVEGGEFDELELQVFDLLGRQVAYKQTRGNNQIELTKGNLQTGMYVYRLIGDNKLISTGKVSVE